MKEGRPTIYTLELADIICERIASGDSMRSVARDLTMPAMTTLFRWLREDEEFRKQYEIAKVESADAWADDIVDIPDNQTGIPLIIDGLPQTDPDGKPLMIIDSVAVAHARLRVDSRKWAASKLKPKKYGDKLQTDHTSSDGSMTPTFGSLYGSDAKPES